eukprot:521244_1
MSQSQCLHFTQKNQLEFIHKILCMDPFERGDLWGKQPAVDMCMECVWILCLKSQDLQLHLRIANDILKHLKQNQEYLFTKIDPTASVKILFIIHGVMDLYEALFEVISLKGTLHFMLKTKHKFQTLTQILFNLFNMLHLSAKLLNRITDQKLVPKDMKVRLLQYRTEANQYLVDTFLLCDCRKRHFKWIIQMDRNKFFCNEILPHFCGFTPNKYTNPNTPNTLSRNEALSLISLFIAQQLFFHQIDINKYVINEECNKSFDQFVKLMTPRNTIFAGQMLRWCHSNMPVGKWERNTYLKLRVKCNNIICNKTYSYHKYGKYIDTANFSYDLLIPLKSSIALNKWYKCNGCKEFYYCCRRCQKLDWNKGNHKKLCLMLRRHDTD